MLALIAAVLFVIGIFVYGTTHGWVFWLLLGLVALSLHFVFDFALPAIGVRRRT